jgi:hypothetical protein
MIVVVGDAIGDGRQDQWLGVGTGKSYLSAEVVGIEGIRVQREVWTMLLQRSHGQEGNVDFPEPGVGPWPR